MSWKIRHEGSPKSVEGLSLQQVAEGLQDGRWEPTDEVMGPQDKGWVVIENHPRLAEVAADLEPPAPPHHDDETHLDMNALIDVCLVLLVFFMLLLVYAVALQKMIDSPELNADNPDHVPVVKKEVVEKSMILVRITMEKEKPVIKIEDRRTAKPPSLHGSDRPGQVRPSVLAAHREQPPGDVV